MSVDSEEPGGEVKHGNLSNFGASVNLLKFMIGLGILSLPYATAQVGWIPALLGMAIIGSITAAGIILGVMAKERLDHPDFLEAKPLIKNNPGQWQDVSTFGLGSFEQIVGYVLGWQSQYLYALSIALSQFSAGVVYIDVITKTEDLTVRVYVLLAVGAGLSILSLIPTLRGVAVISGLGLTIYIFFFAVLICKLTQGPEASAVMVNHETLNVGAWFGITNFAFSAFPIAFVIYDDMRDRASFQKVTAWTTSVCWAVYSAFAITGYMCYGSDTKVLIFDNFSEASIQNASFAALCAILLFSYIIQMMPLYNLASQSCSRWKSLQGWADSSPTVFTALARWPLIWLSVLVAFVIPDIAKVINTAVAASAVLSGFVFPGVVYFQLSSWHEWKARFLCLVVIVVGFGGGISSITSS